VQRIALSATEGPAELADDDVLMKQQELFPQRLIQAIRLPQIGAIGPGHVWWREKIHRVAGDPQ
jgi:hypothetical protein